MKQKLNACFPVGYAWTSPFTRWGGALSEVSSLDFGAAVTRRALEERRVDPSSLNSVVLGWTVPQPQIFYGAPTLAARVGAEHTSGPMVSQACATGVAALEVAVNRSGADGMNELALVVGVDRTSNSPHLVYARPSAPGGTPLSENWMMDNFSCDPWAGYPMIDTAEAVAHEAGITRQELDELTALRYKQYLDALANDRAVQRRYFVDVHLDSRRKTVVVDEDSGVRPSTIEGLAALAPVVEGGLHTYGTQTHPADAAAGMLVTTPDAARDLGATRGLAHILAFGWARVEKARMAKAPAPAALQALSRAGLTPRDVDLVTTHNPFAVNDIVLSRELGIPLEKMNIYGSSLIYGHPQAPTGLRAIVELAEGLSARGGGIGLFTGCAAGDTAGAVIVRVE